MNRLWHTAFGIDQLHSTANGTRRKYHVLIAGERRYRALSLLWKEGCAECHDEYGKEPAGTCFKRHFHKGNDRVEVRLCVNAPPLPTLFLQLSENTHMAVPPYEEAQAYILLFRLVRQADEKFSVAQFASRVGRSPETVRNALRFSELPVGVRVYVEKGAIRYGIGIELTRLHRAGLKAKELERRKIGPRLLINGVVCPSVGSGKSWACRRIVKTAPFCFTEFAGGRLVPTFLRSKKSGSRFRGSEHRDSVRISFFKIKHGRLAQW